MDIECLSPYTPISSKNAIKKDFFIQSRKEDIRSVYIFHHKVYLYLQSPSDVEVMELFIKPL
jgi:hypothetical protein